MGTLLNQTSLFLLTLLALTGSFALEGREPTAEEKLRFITEKDIDDIAQLKAMAKRKFEETAKKGVTALRDAHAQHHGCVKADFEVLANIPPLYRVGAFAFKDQLPPKYKSWIRFSNGSGKVAPDFIPDGRGAAIKILGVAGDRMALEKDVERTSQDFIMINFPQFFVKNAGKYIDFFQNPLAYFKANEVERDIAEKTALQFMTSPLEAHYFSQVPVRFGRRFMRYKITPCENRRTYQVGDLDLRPLERLYDKYKTIPEVVANAAEFKQYAAYLRPALSEQLQAREGCFYFEVQLRENPDTEPVTDPTRGWNTAFTRLARITIPRIEVPIPPSTDRLSAWNQFCEDLSYSPAHGLLAHEHVGSVQEARREIYRMISDMRHLHNGRDPFEPTGNEPHGAKQ